MHRRHFVSTLLTSLASADLMAASPAAINRVLVMFKCHLDVGFVDTQAAIIGKYFNEYFPQAITTALTLRHTGKDRYVWTTGSWLLYSYLEQATGAAKKAMEQAIARGDIAWHALPFTWQTELLDRSAILGGIGFSKALDKRFGLHTQGAKMTDVPGHTRGLVGPMAASDITFLDIGVNSASTPPDVPPLFIWQDVDGAQLSVMYHRSDYGGVVEVPGSDLAIAIEVRDDNSGPHTVSEIHEIYARLRSQFPEAEIRAASLDDIAKAIRPYSRRFPVFTQEIGDTWIHGVASDPTKLSQFRELLRLRSEWVRSGAVTPGDKQDLAFLQRFLLGAEHTWGTDTKTWLDFNHYTPGSLASMLDDPKYKTVTDSWVEKRNDLEQGVSALALDLRQQARKRMAALRPQRPDLAGLQLLEDGEILETPIFRVGFDQKTGAMTHLENKRTGQQLASESNPLALFSYQTLSQADYDRFLASYITVKTDWAPKDFGKPNIAAFGAASGVWNAVSTRVMRGASGNGTRMAIELAFGAQNADAVTAWPGQAYFDIEIAHDRPEILIDFSWFNKRANRLPEALWLSFSPSGLTSGAWSLSKTERPVAPFDVVTGGNRHMHALTGPLAYRDGSTRFSLESWDAAVVALGVMSPLPFSNEQPDLSKGFHYSLFNNAWGTNYVQWFSDNARFRFRMVCA